MADHSSDLEGGRSVGRAYMHGDMQPRWSESCRLPLIEKAGKATTHPCRISGHSGDVLKAVQRISRGGYCWLRVWRLRLVLIDGDLVGFDVILEDDVQKQKIRFLERSA